MFIKKFHKCALSATNIKQLKICKDTFEIVVWFVNLLIRLLI